MECRRLNNEEAQINQTRMGLALADLILVAKQAMPKRVVDKMNWPVTKLKRPAV